MRSMVVVVVLLAVLGCDEAPPEKAAPLPVATSATASAKPPVKTPRGHPPVRQPPQPRPPAKPVGEHTLAEHILGADRLHIWEVGDKNADAGLRLATTLVTDKGLIARIKEAIGFAQKPKPPKEPCKPCRSPARFVFQSPLGMDLGGVDIGCDGDPKGVGRYWQPASSTCGLVKLEKPGALEELIAEAKKKQPKKYPGQAGLP